MRSDGRTLAMLNIWHPDVADWEPYTSYSRNQAFARPVCHRLWIYSVLELTI